MDNRSGFDPERLPPDLKRRIGPLYQPSTTTHRFLQANHVYHGDARELLPQIRPNSITLSVWSPPYFVGKQYESHLTFSAWQELIKEVIARHFPVVKPGGFLVVNIADILCFKDPCMPKIQAEAVSQRRSRITVEQARQAAEAHPHLNRHQLARLMGCSEQTLDRRLHGNNIRGVKHDVQTRVKIVGGLVEQWALDAGFYPYDRRIWVKDPAWENSRWASLSYRAVDEFEYLYFFWKPGITRVDRSRLTKDEWKHWGSRGVWTFASVRVNDDHEAKFPIELPWRTIRLLTDPGDVVLDCFMGSGTTACAAIREGRQYIGVEIQKHYVELARSRVLAEKRGEHANRP